MWRITSRICDTCSAQHYAADILSSLEPDLSHTRLIAAALVCAAPMCAATPSQAQLVGATSYTTLPFVTEIYRPCWQCTVGLDPRQLFFSANKNSPFLDTSLMAQVRALAAKQSAAGIVPTAGMQRWEDTYEASFPAGTFPNEPSWITADRTAGNFPKLPEFVAWRNYITNHPQYVDVAFDGGSMPPQADYFRSWGGSWGHISPLTPLDAADCPPSQPGVCNWGDAFAYRWAQTTKVTGGYGLQLSDFTDGQPYQNTLHDMNPRIVSAFSATFAEGFGVPAGTVAVQSAWINKHAYSRWTDFLGHGYAAFYAALAKQAGMAAQHPALLVGQCSISPAFKRTEGVDERLILSQVSNENFMCIWDDQITQIGRSGPVATPPIAELAGYVLAAAREPAMRNGANLEADDAAYWAAIASFYPSLSATSQTDVGLALLKRVWIWSAWAHIADRAGDVRRAIAFVSRDYWDVGTLHRLAPMPSLITSLVPTQPFGAALYYPVSVERATEAANAATLPPGAVPNTYLAPADLQMLLDSGAPIGYYISDAALPKISVAAGNAPSAWVVIDPANLLPAAEMAQLKAVAPVVTSLSQLAALPDQPLLFSPGLAGFGFRAQTGQVVVVASNPSTAATAPSVTGSIAARVGNGSFVVTEKLSNTRTTLTAVAGVVTVPVNLSPWDTKVFMFAPK